MVGSVCRFEQTEGDKLRFAVSLLHRPGVTSCGLNFEPYNTTKSVDVAAPIALEINTRHQF